MISTPELFETIDSTWPAAAFSQAGAFTLRDGQGGGKRVSAASTPHEPGAADIEAAAEGMRAMGQAPLFMVGAGQGRLEASLAMLGYQPIDRCHTYAAPVERLTDQPIPKVTILPNWEPLAITREIWAKGGTGPARVAIMERAAGPKTALLGRWDDSPGGAAFVAIHGKVAMLHALEILPHQRRKGLAQWMMRAAAFWARDNGAETLSLIVTCDNVGANALYSSLGMEIVGGYHYRYLPDTAD